MTNKIYDGDVKARVNAVIESYKATGCYFNDEMRNHSVSVKNIAKLYKIAGWKAVAELIKDVNELCWIEYSLGNENVSRFYAELYHAAAAWYQGYPANKEEEKLGGVSRVSDEDFSNIYEFLD